MASERDINALDFTGLVRAGDRVVWGQGGAEPLSLTEHLMAQRRAIGGFRAFVGMSLSTTVSEAFTDYVRFESYCASGSNRQLAKSRLLNIWPCHYSQLARSMEPVDVLLLQVAEGPEGYSYSCAAEYLAQMVNSARLVIAEVNDQAPWTYGELLDEEDIDILIRSSRRPFELGSSKEGEVERLIAEHVAGLIEDGSTLQLGIGSLPDTILKGLSSHRELGIHSGALSDTVVDLMQQGVINNSRKSVDLGVSVAGALFGSQKLYDFVHRNPQIQLRSTAYTHDPAVLARQDRLVTLNSAIEVDLTGQVNAETVGGTYVGAVGGAMDFQRGAHASRGGLPIIVLPSTAAAGKVSRIVPKLREQVSSPRADAGIFVTEYGVADLRGKTLAEREKAMRSICHPAFRDHLLA